MARLLNLPHEVLDQVLEYAVPIRKLVPHTLLDPAWSRRCEEGRETPALFTVNKALSVRTTAFFYGRAILELPIAQLPKFIFSSGERPVRSLDLSLGTRASLQHCPHISRIQRVHLYSNQRDVIAQEGYEATLGFLVKETAVQNIVLSSPRSMARIRRFPIDLDVLASICTGTPDTNQVRRIHVYGTHPRTVYEREQMTNLTKRNPDPPPSVQVYLFRGDQGCDPVLDPRWDQRGLSYWQRPEDVRRVCTFIDRLASQDATLRIPPGAVDSGVSFVDRPYAVIYVLPGTRYF